MIQFTRPLLLLLLLPMGFYTWWLTRRSLADLSQFRHKLAFGLRIAIIILLVFALAGARIVRNSANQCVVFVLDVSDSITKAKQDAGLEYINNAIKTMKPDQQVGLVVFGSDASVELSPSTSGRIEKVYSVPSTSNTDISQALGLALATFPEQCAKKIVLLSDGNETIGKSIEQAMLAGSNDVSIDTVPLTSELPREALLEKMAIPSGVKIGEPFDIKIVAAAKQPSVANIRLIRNGAPVDLKAVELPAGKSVLTFKQSIPKPGGYEYQAILECANDTRAENNRALGYTKVTGKPRVLYIEGKQGQAKYLTNALTSSDITIDTRDRSGIPVSIPEMQKYDMVVLSDVPAWNMAAEQMEMFKSGVKDLGIGLTMIGGDESLGAGGYYGSPIEQALPVDMSVRKSKVLPTLTVVIVMDKSGSMGMPEGGKTKIELANDAAASVVELLQPIDYVSVIVCHSSPSAAVDLQMATNKGPIYDQISTIRAEGGGIAVFPSMQMAYDTISQSNTRQKHIILLADGSDCDDQEGVIPLAKKMANEKITVTTVAIGDGPHVPFLKATAATGKGYYYLAKRATDLKAIFTKDVMEVSKSLIVEEPFVPRMDTTSPELSGINQSGCPPLLGYVMTSAKPTARVLMTSHKNDPILATWQYGLGKSAAFMSDCKARWSARWLGWPGYNKFWAQVVRSTMRKSGPRDFQTAVDIDSGVGRVTIDAVDTKGGFLNYLKFAGSVIGPDMKAKPIVVEQTGPGRYESSFDARSVGTYVVSVAQKGGSDISPDVNVIGIPYPPEYKDMSPNEPLLQRISQETSGKFNPDSSRVFGGNFRKSKTFTDIWRLLLIISMLLLPIDVAVRRVAFSVEMLEEVCGAALSRIKSLKDVSRRSAKPARSEAMSSLLKAKKSVAKPLIPDEQLKPQIPVEPVQNAQKPDKQPEKKPEPVVQAGETTSRLLAAKRRARGDSETDDKS